MAIKGGLFNEIKMNRRSQRARNQLKQAFEKSGEDFDAFEKEFANKQNELASKPFGVNVPDEALEGLLNTGRFKSMLEGVEGKGSNDVGHRKRVEGENFGDDSDLYNPKYRPIYGWLDEQSEMKASDYGDYSFIPKESVRERTTMSLGDTFATPAGRFGVTDWHMIHNIGEDVDDDLWQKFMEDEGTPQSYVRRAKSKLFDRYYPKHNGYNEVQIHGGLPLTDIAEIRDNYSVPSIDERNIEILKKISDKYGKPPILVRSDKGGYKCIYNCKE